MAPRYLDPMHRFLDKGTRITILEGPFTGPEGLGKFCGLLDHMPRLHRYVLPRTGCSNNCRGAIITDTTLRGIVFPLRHRYMVNCATPSSLARLATVHPLPWSCSINA